MTFIDIHNRLDRVGIGLRRSFASAETISLRLIAPSRNTPDPSRTHVSLLPRPCQLIGKVCIRCWIALRHVAGLRQAGVRQ
jgi:hypothetical protein